MAATQIGAQLFTVYQFCKTPADFAASCKKIQAMGYQAVQVSGVGPMPTEELVKILRDHGLTCAVTHVALDMMKDTQKCLDYHQALDCKYTAIGGYWSEDTSTANLTKFADEYTQIAATLLSKGLRIGYHNHSRELACVSDGNKRILDLLIERCGKEVFFEIDTYWIAHGGGDPAAWIDKVKNRCHCIHVKDMLVNVKQEQFMTEVGDGNLNWPRILESCKKAGVEYYLVERDSGPTDAFDSLRISLNNLKAMGLK
ncbi:MAG: sugar phosphate isomerase/epimerase [Phycisphaeraceae bacterium]|nr:sugar phosphate isomerase/epimerase [Phycisphaeraceae bacterium]